MHIFFYWFLAAPFLIQRSICDIHIYWPDESDSDVCNKKGGIAALRDLHDTFSKLLITATFPRLMSCNPDKSEIRFTTLDFRRNDIIFLPEVFAYLYNHDAILGLGGIL